MKDVHRPASTIRLSEAGLSTPPPPPPPRLQILRIDGKGMIDDVIMQGTLRRL